MTPFAAACAFGLFHRGTYDFVQLDPKLEAELFKVLVGCSSKKGGENMGAGQGRGV